MHQADCVANGIDEENGATIRDVNAERNAALVRDQTIATGEAFILLERAIDHGDFAAMNLLRGDERFPGQAIFRSHRAMDAVETSQRFRFVLRDLDSRNAADETMDERFLRAERRKFFDRQSGTVHRESGYSYFPDPVWRTERFTG